MPGFAGFARFGARTGQSISVVDTGGRDNSIWAQRRFSGCASCGLSHCGVSYRRRITFTVVRNPVRVGFAHHGDDGGERNKRP